MKLPSVAFALSLSLVVGVVTARLLIAPIDAEAAERLRRIDAACEGYQALHVLLRSARDAEDFRRRGRCREILEGLERH